MQPAPFRNPPTYRDDRLRRSKTVFSGTHDKDNALLFPTQELYALRIPRVLTAFGHGAVGSRWDIDGGRGVGRDVDFPMEASSWIFQLLNIPSRVSICGRLQ